MFTTKLDIRFVDVNVYELINPLKFNTDKYEIEIKSGFKFDGGSIPRLFQAIECPMSYAMAYASCVHDALYGSGKLSRKEADKVFYKALIACGMGTLEALAIWKAVRIGGEDHYKPSKNDNNLAVVLKD